MNKDFSHAMGRPFRSRDQSMEHTLRKPRVRFVVNIESVKASIVKDAFSMGCIVALWAGLWWAGARPGFIAGVLCVLLALTGLKELLHRTTRQGKAGIVKVYSVKPQDALDFIEQEIAEALAEAKEKGDLV